MFRGRSDADSPGGLSAEPLRFRIIWVPIGHRRPEVTTACIALSSLNVIGSRLSASRDALFGEERRFTDG